MADYVYTLVLVYVVLIFIQVIVSFIPRMPYNRYLSAVLGFVGDVVEPVPAPLAQGAAAWCASGPARSTSARWSGRSCCSSWRGIVADLIRG